MADEKDKKNVLKTTDFKSTGDWINRLIEKHCMDKDAEGKTKKTTLNVERLSALGVENHLAVKSYPNTGMSRMNIGNMLRAAARKRGGLNVNGKWQKADDDFAVHDPVSENRDGSKIKKRKEEKEAA